MEYNKRTKFASNYLAQWVSDDKAAAWILDLKEAAEARARELASQQLAASLLFDIWTDRHRNQKTKEEEEEPNKDAHNEYYPQKAETKETKKTTSAVLKRHKKHKKPAKPAAKPLVLLEEPLVLCSTCQVEYRVHFERGHFKSRDHVRAVKEQQQEREAKETKKVKKVKELKEVKESTELKKSTCIRGVYYRKDECVILAYRGKSGQPKYGRALIMDFRAKGSGEEMDILWLAKFKTLKKSSRQAYRKPSKTNEPPSWVVTTQRQWAPCDALDSHVPADELVDSMARFDPFLQTWTF